MVTAGQAGDGRRQLGPLSSGSILAPVLLLLACNAPPVDEGARVDDAELAGLTAQDEPIAPDASGCNVHLSPTVGVPVPAVLAAAGPWQLCGTYGTGGAQLVSTSYDSRRLALLTDSGQVWVMGARNFKLQGVFAHGTGAISFAALSPDGKLLATVDDAEGRVALWNVPKQKLLRVMTRPPSAPSYFGLGAVAFSHDGARVAVVSNTHIDVYDVATGAPLPISSRSDVGGAMSVAFAASDTRLVLGRFSYYGNGPYAGWGNVDLVDATTGDNRLTLAKDHYIQLPTVAVSGDGNTIAVGATQASRSLSFFDARTGQATGELALEAVPLALDVNGARVATIDPPTPQQSPESPIAVSVRNVADGSVVQTVTVPASTVFTRAKRLYVTADLGGLLVGDVAPNVLTRIKLDNGRTQAVACGAGHYTDVAALAISGDGQTLVSTGDYYDGYRRLAWDVATGAPVDAVPPPEALRGPSATSPDGTLQIVTSEDDASATFSVRDTASGAIVRSFGPQPSHPRTFDFAPDGSAIASSSDRDPADRRAPPVADVWDVATGAHEQSVRIITTLPEATAQAVLFGDADRLFVAGYATTARWCRAGGR
jgi:WD40 repeat protein